MLMNFKDPKKRRLCGRDLYFNQDYLTSTTINVLAFTSAWFMSHRSQILY